MHARTHARCLHHRLVPRTHAHGHTTITTTLVHAITCISSLSRMADNTCGRVYSVFMCGRIHYNQVFCSDNLVLLEIGKG